MKWHTVIDPKGEEEVIIRARRRTPLVEALEGVLRSHGREIIGYRGREGTYLDPAGIFCFTVEDDRVFALTAEGRYQIRCRLYQLEEILPPEFVKIHQSAIANLQQIRRFDASVSGTLKVVYKNGTVDYVSRRNLRVVKERLGLK